MINFKITSIIWFRLRQMYSTVPVEFIWYFLMKYIPYQPTNLRTKGNAYELYLNIIPKKYCYVFMYVRTDRYSCVLQKENTTYVRYRINWQTVRRENMRKKFYHTNEKMKWECLEQKWFFFLGQRRKHTGIVL